MNSHSSFATLMKPKVSKQEHVRSVSPLFNSNSGAQEIFLKCKKRQNPLNPSVPGGINWRISVFEKQLHETETSKNVVGMD